MESFSSPWWVAGFQFLAESQLIVLQKLGLGWILVWLPDRPISDASQWAEEPDSLTSVSIDNKNLRVSHRGGCKKFDRRRVLN